MKNMNDLNSMEGDLDAVTKAANSLMTSALKQINSITKENISDEDKEALKNSLDVMSIAEKDLATANILTSQAKEALKKMRTL